MDYKDYYKILGVERSASQKDIKSAYRKLTKKYHPDLNHGNKDAEVKYRDVNEAYEVLGDPDKRSKYDQFGNQWKYVKNGQTPPGGGSYGDFDFSDIFSQFTQGQGGGGAHFSSFNGASGFSPFFESLFGGGGPGMGGGRTSGFGGGFGSAGTGRAKPKTLESELEISLAEAYAGTSRNIKISVPDTCSSCHGAGVTGNSVCGVCGGRGRISRTHTLDVNIPAGVLKLKVSGSKHGISGDIMLSIRISPDRVYKVEGRDLRCDLPVSLRQAVLGGSTELKLPNGKTLSIDIKPNTPNGRVLCFSELGLPNPKGKAGNIKARVMVKLPETFTPEQIEAVKIISPE